jgi:hypothetical protein
MPNGAAQAVDNATRLSEIGFPEFTAKLITDTFNAITGSYLEQTTQYITLVKAVSASLQDYITNTVDDISADEIGSFLISLGALNNNALNFLLGDSTTPGSLSASETTALNNALTLPPAASGVAAAAIPSGALNNNRKQAIAAAIARRIAANKYDLLQTMVRQGVLRLYVDNGTIETRLTFTTYGSAVSSASKSNRQRLEENAASAGGAAGGIGGTGGIVTAGFGGGFASGRASSQLTVSTANSSQRDVTGSRVQIFGRVKLNFKTDLLPLTSQQP